jgi:CHASE3 domain sensor protein
MAEVVRSGRGLAVLALIISVIALGISLLAYQEVGGTRALMRQVERLQDIVEAARRESADALQRIERSVRPADREPGARNPGGGA